MKVCCRCEGPRHKPEKAYCRECTAAVAREYRKTHSATLTPPQRAKNKVRCKSRHALRKGVLKMEPCVACGDLEVEIHHQDYSRPMDVTWVCKEHHLLITLEARRIS